MPIKIPQGLPVNEKLKEEKIFTMAEKRAKTQDIRPLNIVILNLMPEKEKTELQLLRLLGNTPLQVNVTFLNMATHVSKNVSASHLNTFYSTFEDVKYWEELVEIMEWSKKSVTSVFNICWGAQAALYHHYGIKKYELPKKLSGIYKHNVRDFKLELVRGFDEEYLAPHSRYTEV